MRRTSLSGKNSGRANIYSCYASPKAALDEYEQMLSALVSGCKRTLPDNQIRWLSNWAAVQRMWEDLFCSKHSQSLRMLFPNVRTSYTFRGPDIRECCFSWWSRLASQWGLHLRCPLGALHGNQGQIELGLRAKAFQGDTFHSILTYLCLYHPEKKSSKSPDRWWKHPMLLCAEGDCFSVSNLIAGGKLGCDGWNETHRQPRDR